MEHFSSAGGSIWQVKHDYYNKLLHKLPDGSVSLSCPIIFFHDWSIAFVPNAPFLFPYGFQGVGKVCTGKKWLDELFVGNSHESLIKQTVPPLCCYNPGYPHLAVKRQCPGTEDLRVHVYLCTLKSRATFNSQRWMLVHKILALLLIC